MPTCTVIPIVGSAALRPFSPAHQSVSATMGITASIVALAAVSSMTAGAYEPSQSASMATLSWSAPEECPQLDFVAARIAKLVRGLQVRAQRQFSFVVRARGDEGQFTLRMLDAEGATRRLIRHRDCRQLAEAAAVLVSLALEAAAEQPELPAPSGKADTKASERDRSPQRSSASASDPDSAGAQTRSGPPERSGTAQRRISRAEMYAPELNAEYAPREPRKTSDLPGVQTSGLTGFSLRLEAEGRYGLVPGLWPALRLGLDLQFARWAIESEIRSMPIARVYAHERPQVGAQLFDLALASHACWTAIAGRVQLPLCLGASAALMRARGIGALREVRVRYAPALQLEARIQLRWSRTRWAWTLGLDGLWAMGKPSFVLDGLDERVCCDSAWGLRLASGVAFQWPRRPRRVGRGSTSEARRSSARPRAQRR